MSTETTREKKRQLSIPVDMLVEIYDENTRSNTGRARKEWLNTTEEMLLLLRDGLTYRRLISEGKMSPPDPIASVTMNPK